MNSRECPSASTNLSDKRCDKKITDLAKHVLNESAVDFEREGKFSDANLLKLFNVFGVIFERALELYDSGRVSRISVVEPGQSKAEEERNSARWLLQVQGHSDGSYTIFPQLNYCPCAAFRYQVLGEHSDLTCKHVLAAWLSIVDSEKLISKIITPTQYKNLLLYQFSN